MCRLHYSYIIWATSNLRGRQNAYPKHWRVLCCLRRSPGHHPDHLPAPLHPPQYPHLKEKKGTSRDSTAICFRICCLQLTDKGWAFRTFWLLVLHRQSSGFRKVLWSLRRFLVGWLVGACKGIQKWEISPGFDKSHVVADSVQSVLIFISSS